MTACIRTICIAIFLFLSLAILPIYGDSSDSVSAVSVMNPRYMAVVEEPVSLEDAFEQLRAVSPIAYEPTPEVRRHIEKFLSQRRSDLELYLERSQYYFPLFESTLDKYELPLELKYLAVIESGLNPMAKSKSGAVGLWQFLYGTGTLFNLEVDSYIDERRDPYKSTEAACQYLEYLYRTYGDWNLVMAGYNGGPGDVRKAIERSGGKTNYWELRPYLSNQAQHYVPAFMAMTYLMQYPELHNLKARGGEVALYPTDTLMLNYAISFEQIAAVIHVPLAELQNLNPQYRRSFIPKRSEPCTLVLPEDKIPDYLKHEREILGYESSETDYHVLCANAGNTHNRVHRTHTVKPGEYAHKIAVEYECTIENIKAWNNLDSMGLHPGQVLDIWVKENSK